MAEPTGLRERKKQRTRRTLVETGLRLFDERGYDRTTIGDICAAAELAPATFYTHFPTKEDLVFADQPERAGAVRAVITGRRPGEPPRAVLMRCIELGLQPGRWAIDPDEDLLAIRSKLITTVPALRAAALRWLFDVQDDWAQALVEAYPGELDDLTAHALIGAVTGAAISAALANLSKGADAAPTPEVVTRAVEIALTGLPPSTT